MKRSSPTNKQNPRAAVVLIGAPGSGKTTLARGLAERQPIEIIEIGNLLKREVTRGTALGKTIAPFTEAGKLVPIKLVEKVVSKALKKTQDNIVLFDGLPRSEDQIEPFLNLIAANHLELRAVIILTIRLQSALNRLSGRRICDQCGTLYNLAKSKRKSCGKCGGKLVQRADDCKAVVRKRFKRFERETMPVIKFFKREFAPFTWEQSATTPKEQRINRVWQKLRKTIPQLAS